MASCRHRPSGSCQDDQRRAALPQPASWARHSPARRRARRSPNAHHSRTRSRPVRSLPPFPHRTDGPARRWNRVRQPFDAGKRNDQAAEFLRSALAGSVRTNARLQAPPSIGRAFTQRQVVIRPLPREARIPARMAKQHAPTGRVPHVPLSRPTRIRVEFHMTRSPYRPWSERLQIERVVMQCFDASVGVDTKRPGFRHRRPDGEAQARLLVRPLRPNLRDHGGVEEKNNG